MRRPLAAALVVVVLVVAVAGWLVWRGRSAPEARSAAAVQAIPLPESGGVEGVESVDADGEPPPTGGTPMAERVAVVGLLNKRNGVSREVTLKPGQATRIGDVVIRLDACEKTAPWEPDPLTGAFVRLDVRGPDGRWRRPFSGWLFRERPALNVVRHPVYDVWAKSCTMSWPETGPGTVSLAGRRSSSASQRPDSAPASDREAAPVTPATAASSNAI